MGQPALAKNWIQIASFHDGLARVVSPEGKTGFLDRNGQLALAATWQSAGDFQEGLAWVRQEGEYGYIGPTAPPSSRRSGRRVAISMKVWLRLPRKKDLATSTSPTLLS